jgi:hypothetical protein
VAANAKIERSSRKRNLLSRRNDKSHEIVGDENKNIFIS